MKNLLIFLFLLPASFQASGQICEDTYGSLREGTVMEYASYNKKGELEHTFQHQCKNIEQSGDTIIAWFDIRGQDAKGESPFNGLYGVKCHNDILYMDMQSMIPNMTAAQQSSMEVSIEGTALAFPSNMKPGMTLPDGEMVMKAGMEGMTVMQMRYYMTDRKVEAQETITTKAGTFECLRISYNLEFRLMGARSYRSVQWIAKEVGMIRSESYDKKGKLESSMELTKFVKG